jgi:hypothetical protein
MQFFRPFFRFEKNFKKVVDELEKSSIILTSQYKLYENDREKTARGAAQVD